MQSTGQTSTQALSLTSIHGSTITYVMVISPSSAPPLSSGVDDSVLEFASRQPTTLGMSVFDDEVLPVFVAELGEPLLEGLVVRGDNWCRSQYSDPEDSRRWLGLGGERRREAESKNDREPDHAHGHLGGGRLARSLADVSMCGFQCDEKHAAEAVIHGPRARGPARAIRSLDPPAPKATAGS